MHKSISIVIFLIQINFISGFSQTKIELNNETQYSNLSVENQTVDSNIETQKTLLNEYVEAPADTISKTDKGYFIGTKALTKQQLLEILKSNNASNQVYKKAETWSYILFVPAIIGGAMVGYPLGRAAGGGDFNAPVFGIGAGVVTATLISAALIDSSTLKKSIKAYNKSVLSK
ncbi:MAG: hypothetical protein EAZ53_10375 [Bacteroidetes bacterium]|nr:MAG: hypothetical protein EAZ53_10375 [Bacteroidota bacterium]